MLLNYTNINFRLKTTSAILLWQITYFAKYIHFYKFFFVLNEVSMLARLAAWAYAFAWTNLIPANRAPRLSQVRFHLNGLTWFARKVKLFLIRKYNETGRLV